MIISGGQTGVDRAALDFALDNGIPCGGWCPKGRFAEDGTIPAHYPLKETDSSDYADRTRKNILDSDGTLIIYSKSMDPGTELTLRLCNDLNKPLMIHSDDFPIQSKDFQSWINNNNIHDLNIAGPRESKITDIYKSTLKILEFLFEF